jgi:large subunit ribosomal protein L22
MKVSAHINHLHMSPRKVRLVVDLVRGMKAQDAIAQLGFVNKRAARPVKKLLQSAVANAEHNHALDPTSLTVSTIRVDEGPTLKRYRPKAMGRASLIARRTSHVSVILEGDRMAGAKPTPKDETLRKEHEGHEHETPAAESSEPTARDKDFEVRKKEGKERNPSFVRRVFRRKSI